MAAIALYKIQISFVVLFVNIWITVVYGSYSCPSVCSCLGSMVDCNKRGLNSVPQDLPTWVEILDLSSNSIPSISPDSFKHLSKLEEIDLTYNKVKQLGKDLFAIIPNLKTLKLSYNDLEEIPSFPLNYSLTQLVLSHNKIRTLEASSLESVPHLRQLDLGFNKISELRNGSFPFLPSLHHLYINNNRINRLGMGSFDTFLPNLEWLKLGKNQIPSLPKEVFKTLKQLKLLDLNKNKLTEIVGLTFIGLENLATLKMRRNNITELAAGAFWGPSKIQTLELDNNSLTQVKKDGLYGLSSLKSLSITNNYIKDIESGSWEFCPHLTTLDLSSNNMVRIDSGTFSKLTSLDGLWLNNNQISYIGTGAFNDLFSVKTLELNNNKISWTIEDMHGPFEGLASLTRLSLESNEIKSITKKAFQGLDQLKQLDLGHNQISTLQNNAFAHLKELQHLDINTSALLCDCKLLWFPTWLNDKSFDNTVLAKCAHPLEARGKSILSVKEFKCDASPKPVIDTSPNSQIALKGNNFTLHCVAWSSSKSPMTIEWRKDNIAVTQAKINTTATMIEGGIKMTSLLMISHARDEHAGDYQCVAANEVGPTYSKKAEIKVHVFPVFTKKPEDYTVKASASIELECAAIGQPVPEISWQKDGGDDFPAARERRMHIQQDSDIYYITNVKPEDQGVYSCMATNGAGTIVTNATLTVLEVPKFAEHMKDASAEQGSTAVIECMAQGAPKPKLEWYKDGQPLEPNLTERHFFTASDQLLIIVEAKPEDSGDYTCKITNTLGSASESMKLMVTSSGGLGKPVSFFNDSTTTGIIIIAVVCCVVGTSLIWVVIIYQTRRKNEEYSSTPTEETTIPEVAYNSGEQNGYTTTRTIYTAQGPYSKVYNMNGGTHFQNGGVHMNGGFNITRNPLGNEDWEGGQGEFEQDSREPLVSTSTSGSNHSNHHHLRGAQRSSSSISVASCTSSSSSCSCSHHSSSNTHSSNVVLSTFHPYPLGNPSVSGGEVRNERGDLVRSSTSSSQCGAMPSSFTTQPADPGGIHHPAMLQEGSPQCATFPRQHNIVHKTSSCSHIQPQQQSQQHNEPHQTSSPSDHNLPASNHHSPTLPQHQQPPCLSNGINDSNDTSNSSSSSNSCHEKLDTNHNKRKIDVVNNDICSVPPVVTVHNDAVKTSPHSNDVVNGNNNNSPTTLSPLREDEDCGRGDEVCDVTDIADKNHCVVNSDSEDNVVTCGDFNSQTDHTTSDLTTGLLSVAVSGNNKNLNNNSGAATGGSCRQKLLTSEQQKQTPEMESLVYSNNNTVTA